MVYLLLASFSLRCVFWFRFSYSGSWALVLKLCNRVNQICVLACCSPRDLCRFNQLPCCQLRYSHFHQKGKKRRKKERQKRNKAQEEHTNTLKMIMVIKSTHLVTCTHSNANRPTSWWWCDLWFLHCCKAFLCNKVIRHWVGSLFCVPPFILISFLCSRWWGTWTKASALPTHLAYVMTNDLL